MKKIEKIMEKIIWDDAGSFGKDEQTWHTLEESKEAYGNVSFICSSYGIVLWEDNDAIIIAQSIAHNNKSHQDEYSNFLRIPKVLLIKRIEIKEKE